MAPQRIIVNSKVAHMKINQNKTITSRTEFFYYAFRNILLIGLPLVLVSAFVLSLPHSSATISNSESDNLTLTLSTSCTIRSDVEEAHNASLHGGQYEDEIGSTKISTYCNDNNGYSIYAIGSSGDIDGNTDLISNISDNYNIHTGIYDSSNVSSYTPSSWSMKLSPGSGTGINPDTGASITTTPPTIRNNYDSYSLVPNIYTLVASRDSSTNMTVDTNASGSYFTTTYDIYAASFQPSGTYIGKVKYLIIHPSNNTITNNVEGAFASAGKEKIHYDENGNGPYFAMQDMTTNICNAITIYDEASQTQLVDIRDGKTYYIAKLRDGHCWMTQNLDFDLSSSIALNSNTTDLNVVYNSSTGQYAEYDNGYAQLNNTIYYQPINITVNFTSGSGQVVSGWAISETAPSSASKTNNTNTGHSSLGNWYNWTAAIASNDSSSITGGTRDDVSLNPKNSICPKGWRLPTISNQSESVANSTNEFQRINYLYNDNSLYASPKLFTSPLWFVIAGNINSTTPTLNNWNSLWSSSRSDTNLSSCFSIPGSASNVRIYPANNGYKSDGYSIRCLAR